jgi:hypothetical protein
MTHFPAQVRRADSKNAKRRVSNVAGNTGAAGSTNANAKRAKVTESVTSEAAATTTRRDTNKVSRTQHFDTEGRVTSEHEEMFVETSVSYEVKYRIARERGFEMSEIEMYAETADALLQSIRDPIKTFERSGLYKDEHGREVDVALLEAQLLDLAGWLDFESIEEMENESAHPVIFKMLRVWDKAIPIIEAIRFRCYIPFFVSLAAEVCKLMCSKLPGVLAFLGSLPYPYNISSENNYRQITFLHAISSQIENPAGECGSDARDLLNEFDARARIRWANEQHPALPQTMKNILRPGLTCHIESYLQARSNWLCASRKPDRPLPPLPPFTDPIVKRSKQPADTPLEDVLFEVDVNVADFYDPIGGNNQFKLRLETREVAIMFPVDTKIAVRDHHAVFRSGGKNATSNICAKRTSNTLVSLSRGW